MVGREFGANYRFGFNGYENTDEVLGDNTALDFGARIYDCRIAKFFSIDPRSVEYPWQSVYVYYSNCPIAIIDIDGMGGPNKDGNNGQSNELTDSEKAAALTNNNSSLGLTMESVERYLYLNNQPSSTYTFINTYTTYEYSATPYKYTPIEYSDGEALLEGFMGAAADQYLEVRSYFTWKGYSSKWLSTTKTYCLNYATCGLYSGYLAISSTVTTIKSINLSKYDRDDYFYGAGYVTENLFLTFLGAKVSSTVGVARSKDVPSYFRGGNSFEMSTADLRSAVDKTTGLMKERGVSINTNHLDPFIQKYGGAWEVNLSTVHKNLQIKLTSGTHFEIAPKQAGMTLLEYQNLIKQIQVYPFNTWPK